MNQKLKVFVQKNIPLWRCAAQTGAALVHYKRRSAGGALSRRRPWGPGAEVLNRWASFFEFLKKLKAV